MALVVAASICSAPAHAQSGVSIIEIGLRSGQGVTANLAVSGGVTVEFRGDPAAGCEAAGNCDVAGVVSWTPPSDGSLTVSRDKRGGRRVTSGFLDLGAFEDDASTTLAAVHRGDATCSDAVAGGGEFEIPENFGTRVDVSLAGPEADAFDTRCPGPLASDLGNALPRLSLDLTDIKRGHVFDLGGVHSFSASGFAGTVHSSLRLRVTGFQRDSGFFDDNSADSPSPFRRRMRIVSASYRIDELEGRVPISFAGLSDPGACGPVDSCGLTGTMLLEPHLDGGVLVASALGPARRPKRDFLAALGLGRGNPRGIEVAGIGTWDDTGSVSTSNSRGCHDVTPLGGGLLEAHRTRHAMAVRLYASNGLSGPRSRCAAPLFSGGGEPPALATGVAPLREFRLPIGALTLRGHKTVLDDGYSAATAPDITFGIERLHVRSNVFRVP